LKESIIIIRKILIYLSPILILMTIVLFFTSDIICKFLANVVVKSISIDIKIISIILIIGTFNNVIGVLGFINMKMEKIFRNYVITVGIFNIIICIFLSYFFLDIGASISIVLTEFLLFILLLLTLVKKYKRCC